MIVLYLRRLLDQIVPLYTAKHYLQPVILAKN